MEVGLGKVRTGHEVVVHQDYSDVQGLSLEFELEGDVHHPVHQDSSHQPVQLFLPSLNVQRVNLVAQLPRVQETHGFSFPFSYQLQSLLLKGPDLTLEVACLRVHPSFAC